MDNHSNNPSIYFYSDTILKGMLIGRECFTGACFNNLKVPTSFTKPAQKFLISLDNSDLTA